jgi:hypothetical protein
VPDHQQTQPHIRDQATARREPPDTLSVLLVLSGSHRGAAAGSGPFRRRGAVRATKAGLPRPDPRDPVFATTASADR